MILEEDVDFGGIWCLEEIFHGVCMPLVKEVVIFLDI